MIDIEVGVLSPVSGADLFFEPAFFELHRERSQGFFFRLVDGDRLLGITHFTESGEGHYHSPLRGSYGGFWLAPGVGPDELRNFVDRVVSYMKRETTAHKLTVTLPPLAYDMTALSTAVIVLRAYGFEIARSEINQHIPLEASRAFRSTVRKEKRRQLNKLDRQGITGRIANESHYRALYNLLADSRAYGGIPLSMTWDQVNEMLNRFPDRLFFVEATSASSPLAAMLVVLVNRSTAYTLYYGNRSGTDGSPVIKAIESLHDWATSKGYRKIDLGASSIDGTIDRAIYSFKESLGAEASPKFWMDRTL